MPIMTPKTPNHLQLKISSIYHLSIYLYIYITFIRYNNFYNFAQMSSKLIRITIAENPDQIRLGNNWKK